MQVTINKNNSLKITIIILLILNAVIVLSASSPDAIPNPGHSYEEVYLGPIKIADLFVGINTNAPTQALDVNGKIRMQSETQDSDDDTIVATKGYVDNNGGPVFPGKKSFTTSNGQWTTINVQSEYNLDEAPSAIIIEQRWISGQATNSESKFKADGREYLANSIHAGGDGDVESNTFQGIFPVNSDGTIEYYAYRSDGSDRSFRIIGYYP